MYMDDLIRTLQGIDRMDVCPRGIIVSHKTRQSIATEFRDNMLGHGLFFGLEVISCAGFPDTEMFTYRDSREARKFIAAIESLGYEEAKKLFQIIG